jgi:hypothetical protein
VEREREREKQITYQGNSLIPNQFSPTSPVETDSLDSTLFASLSLMLSVCADVHEPLPARIVPRTFSRLVLDVAGRVAGLVFAVM